MSDHGYNKQFFRGIFWLVLDVGRGDLAVSQPDTDILAQDLSRRAQKSQEDLGRARKSKGEQGRAMESKRDQGREIPGCD